MNNKSDLLLYIEEIDRCVEASRRLAITFSENYGMLKGFHENVDWLNAAPVAVIRYINHVNRNLNSQIILTICKLLEQNNSNKIEPGAIAAKSGNKNRVEGDENRTLSRAAKLFEMADRRFPNLMEEKYRLKMSKAPPEWKRPYKPQETYKQAQQNVQMVAKEIEILANGQEFKKLYIIRNEGFAHSVAISRTRISDPIDDWNGDLSGKELYEFGEKITSLAIDFDSFWNSNGQPTCEARVSTRRQVDQGFWNILKAGISN